jgi:hypothetical protein
MQLQQQLKWKWDENTSRYLSISLLPADAMQLTHENTKLRTGTGNCSWECCDKNVFRFGLLLASLLATGISESSIRMQLQGLVIGESVYVDTKRSVKCHDWHSSESGFEIRVLGCQQTLDRPVRFWHTLICIIVLVIHFLMPSSCRQRLSCLSAHVSDDHSAAWCKWWPRRSASAESRLH